MDFFQKTGSIGFAVNNIKQQAQKNKVSIFVDTQKLLVT